MEELIEEAIIRKARGVLRNRRIERATAAKNADRYRKRTGLTPGIPTTGDPTWWAFHPHFDPIYCIRHSRHWSRTIWRKLKANLYHPVPAIQFDVPKPDGTSRKIMAFTIPDCALANVIHKKVTQRNINLFSRLSYAYRPDQNVFDAILNLSKSLANIFFRAHRERVRVLADDFTVIVGNLTRAQIIDGSWYRYSAVSNDVSLPSFVRAWRVARKYYRRYGLSGIEAPRYYSLVDY